MEYQSHNLRNIWIYTKDADKDEDYYDAERDDGYSVSIDYDQTDCIMDVSVSK